MPIMLLGTESPNIKIIPLVLSLSLPPVRFATIPPLARSASLSLSAGASLFLSITGYSKDLRLDRYNHRSLTCGHESIRMDDV